MNNTNPRYIYTVTGDDADLHDWTPESLGDALTAPLAKIGVSVEVLQHQHGGGGLRFMGGAHPVDFELKLAETVAIVDRIIINGP